MYGKKLFKTLFIAVILSTVVLWLFGCFLSAPTGVFVTPVVRAIGLPDASIVGSVTLKVTGPDMDPVEVSYSQLPSVINISIPEGTSRQFELTVGLTPAFIASSSGVATSYRGTVTADVTSDSTVVTLDMGIASTKLVVPDANNHRIVQIDDMSGAGWATLTGSQMNALTTLTNANFFPSDVNIDESGAIYVANNNTGLTQGGIWRFNSITDTNPIRILFANGPYGMKAVAVDRTNKRVYAVYTGGAGNDTVIYSDYAGLPIYGNPFITITGGYTINGIAVADGDVYVCGQGPNSDPFINKYSMNAGTPLATYSTGIPSPIMDITVLNNELYATVNYYSSSPVRIEKFDPATLIHTTSPFSFGVYKANPSAPGDFVGLYNFVAVLNKKLTIIDGTDFSAQLVSFDDIQGTNWETYGSWDNTGNGTGVFKFFSNC